MNKRDRILGGIYAQLLGDILGRPYEMTKPENMPMLPMDLLELPPPPFRQAWPDMPEFAYTDDGARMLCTLETALEYADVDGEWDEVRFANELGRRLLRWLDEGYLAVEGKVFGTGGTTRKALAKIREGCAPFSAGIDAEDALGNGGIMGVLPLPMLHTGSDAGLVECAIAQCRVTHMHPLARATAASFCLWVRLLLKTGTTYSSENTRTYAEHAVCGVARLRPELKEQCNHLLHVLGGHAGPPTGGFHVVDTFYSAVECQRGKSVEEVIRRAIALGNDTDTTAAVAGGVAGMRFGASQISSEWLLTLLMTLPPEALKMFQAVSKQTRYEL